MLVDSLEGKKLNSPNDVVVKGDGTIWFTDPDYGLAGRPKEVPGNYVYRFDPKSNSLSAVVKDFDKPNGLCFSADEKKLYVADSGKPRHIRAFPVNSDGTLGEGAVFAAIDKGGPDGIRCDGKGNVWSSSGDGAQVFSPEGKLLVRILLPESAANLAFGGDKGTTLFLTARKSLYMVETLVRDGKKGKRR
jgi:gluconolactonase